MSASRRHRRQLASLHRALTPLCLGCLLYCGTALPQSESSATDNPPPLPARLFPDLTGPYPVGMRDYFWVDESRAEDATSDPADRRHLRVRVYYPAEPPPGSMVSPYLPAFDEFDEDNAGIFERGKPVRSRSHLDAPLRQRERPWPVLVYNHGGSWSRFTSAFTTETLASEGYVVFSIDHTGFNRSTVFPDGYVYRADAEPWPQPDPALSEVENARIFFAHLEEMVFDDWVADATFVLDRAEALDSDPDSGFGGGLSLDAVGAFGWSFGGATAVQLTVADPRVAAAVDHDGQLFGSVRRSGTRRPFMLLHSDEDHNRDGDPAKQAMIDEITAHNAELRSKSPSASYEIVIDGSTHGSFSDLVFFWPPDQPPENRRRHVRLHHVINELTVQFFDHHLLGLPAGPLLRGEFSRFPEVRPLDR